MEINRPIHRIKLEELNNLWVKREDLSDPFISGNKWRKLKYIVEKAKSLKKNHLVTFGGAHSNHLLATAAAASRNGFQSTAFVRGEKLTNEMLFLCELFGMELRFTDRESYRDKQLLYNRHFANNPSSYFIDEGGASEEAVKGCAEIIDELDQHYDHIFCCAGTGTTAAGLLRGIHKHNLSTKLHVISALKGGEFLREEISKYEKNLEALILHTDYHFGGYAKTKPELLQFIKQFVASTGILIDPVYTGKMFFAIHQLANCGKLNFDDKILALHTGGIFGLFGMQEKFNELII